jgi:hypothetical protein
MILQQVGRQIGNYYLTFKYLKKKKVKLKLMKNLSKNSKTREPPEPALLTWLLICSNVLNL